MLVGDIRFDLSTLRLLIYLFVFVLRWADMTDLPAKHGGVCWHHLCGLSNRIERAHHATNLWSFCTSAQQSQKDNVVLSDHFSDDFYLAHFELDFFVGFFYPNLAIWRAYPKVYFLAVSQQNKLPEKLLALKTIEFRRSLKSRKVLDIGSKKNECNRELQKVFEVHSLFSAALNALRPVQIFFISLRINCQNHNKSTTMSRTKAWDMN